MAEDADNKDEPKTDEDGSKSDAGKPADNSESNKGGFLEEIKSFKEEIKKERELLKKENDRRERLIADKEMQGQGFSGMKKAESESDKDYAKRLISKPYGDKKIETPE